MGEIRLKHCCRLCLKEGFSLTNIFSQCSAAGDPLYQVLNFIYEMKIFKNDCLPSQICSPCMWRMIEFDACKKNVRCAAAEIMRLLSQTRPDDLSEVEVSREQKPVNTEVSIKEEMDIVEWEMPAETVIKVPEAAQRFQESDKDDYNNVESDDVEPLELPEEEYEEKSNEQVFYQPLKVGNGIESVFPDDPNMITIDRASVSSKVTLQGMDLELKQEESELTIVKGDAVQISQNVNSELKQEKLVIHQEEAIQTPGSLDLTNILSLKASEEAVGSSLEGESICSTQGISFEMRDTNKGIHERDLRDDIVPEEESLSSDMSKSILDVGKSGSSHLEGPHSKRKSGFICDICKKSFKGKLDLGRHVWVHYDERPFSCSKCDKTFKSDIVRNQHELRHLRDEINFGKSEKGTKKRLYSCDLCAMNFSSESGLRRHSNVHSYKCKCNSCGKCFRDNAGLRRHIKIHTKEKPFKCEVCLKCFSQKGNLNYHLLSHSSERPYVCDICDKRFKSKGDKAVHALYHLRKK